MSNKIKYGLKNVHYAIVTNNGGVIAYATPVAMPGAVELVLNPKGEKLEFYADDMEYVSEETNQGYEGSLIMAIIPDSFKKDVLGFKEDANGVLFEDKDAKSKDIALLYEFSGDSKKTRRVSYNVSVGRPGAGSKTTQKGKEAQTDSMNITASPAVDTGLVNGKVESGQTPYEGWFTEVYKYVEPTG